MKQDYEYRNNLARNLMGADINIQYDNNVKKILSNKRILAIILKGVAEEFKYYDVEFIEQCIEGNPQVSLVPVEPGVTGYQPEEIVGKDSEDGIVGEGYIRYDLRFEVNLPGLQGTIKLLINLEAQKKTDPGYPIVSRGIFYCGRMISSEYGVEFTSPDYGKIKKVYSIWICMNAEEDAIAVYDVRKNDLVPGIPDRKEDYDLLTVVQIWIRGEKTGMDEKEVEYPVLGMLNTLLNPELKAEEKMEYLSEKYRVPMTYNLKKEVQIMCNLSEGVEERGISIGEKRGISIGDSRRLVKSVELAMKNFHISLEKACEGLETTVEEYRKMKEQIEKSEQK